MRKYKSGNEFLPYHAQASHIPPEYRDGWNSCFSEAEIRITELESQVEALRKDAEWQPIETAPKDVMILIFQPPSRITFSINDGFEYKLATHWKPLPQPPAIAEGGK